MKHNIGSKMAAKLAREKYGDKAFVGRSGKQFYVGVFRIRFWNYLIDKIYGQGKSWETALISAGVEIPTIKIVSDDQVSSAIKQIQTQIDAIPEDTDAKDPGEGIVGM